MEIILNMFAILCYEIINIAESLCQFFCALSLLNSWLHFFSRDRYCKEDWFLLVYAHISVLLFYYFIVL